MLSMTALKKLRESAKGNVMIAIVAAVSAFFYIGKLTPELYSGIVTTIVSVWFGSHAHEKGKIAQAAAGQPSIGEVLTWMDVAAPVAAAAASAKDGEDESK